ncbi:MAG: WD40/YVTN/BNR-like repeat-containing protein, partial [Blastocatellia bacterium]
MTIRKFNLLPALALPLIGVAILYSSNRLAIRATSAAMDHAASQDRPEANRNPRNPDDTQDAAARFYLQKRLPEGEKEIPVERYPEARQQARRMPRYSTAQSRFLSQAEAEADSAAAWAELGPGNLGGRTRALIIHPTDHDTMYAAAAAGGVWKTTDGGASWKALTDVIANLAVNALAIDRNQPDTLYAGTGEGFFNFDAIRGAGIFKTADGGATWTRLAATATPDFHYVNDIVVSPTDGRRVYAATRAGVWRSVDGGASWTRTLDPAVTGGCLDLVIRSDQTTDYLFASCGTAFSQAKVYRNTDASGAGAWTEVLSDPGMGRTSLALAPSNQNIIYAASANPVTSNQPGLHAIFRSTASGDPNTWTAQVRKTDATKLNTALFSWTRDAFFSDCGLGPDRFFNTGWYANSMAVDPIDANRVWVGGVDLFRSDDGGVN